MSDHSFVEGAVKLNDRQRIEDMGLSVKSVMDAATNAFSASKLASLAFAAVSS